MRHWLKLAIILVFLAALAVTPLSSAAQSPEPNTPPTPPTVPEAPEAEQLFTLDAFGLQSYEPLALPPLKAVLLVGPIDGDDGSWTQAEISNMEKAAAVLEQNGVEVHRFYTPNNDWAQIKAAANGAHFLLYRGHGVYWSDMPSPQVGGFFLKNRYVSSDMIQRDLKLHPNAVVMMYACFSAGSSSNDPGPISSTEARRRVAQYSKPFFDLGAGGYFANWFGDAFARYLTYLFQGQTLGQAYESFYDFNPATVERTKHPDHPSMVMWLDKDDWDGIKYNNAFVGLPNLNLRDLFGPRITLTPTQITQYAGPGWVTNVSIEVGSVGGSLTDWTASVPDEVSWLVVENAPELNRLTVHAIAPDTPGNYQGFVEVSSPLAVNGSQTVSIDLIVIEGGPKQVFLPAVVR